MISNKAIIDKRAKIGRGTSVWHFTQIRENVVIGKNCNIGKSSYIGCGARIGDNVKIQNNVNIYECDIGNNVFIGPAVTFTNDRYPRAFDWKNKFPERIVVGEGASIGANTTVVCGVTIGEYAMVGAGSVVTKDVPAYALVYGNPARVKGRVNKKGVRGRNTNDL